MSYSETDDTTLRKVLTSSKSLGIVGMSRNTYKAAGSVPRYLLAKGYRIIPINPNAQTIDHMHAYPSLLDVEEPIDTVVIFRPVEEVPEIVRQAVTRRQKQGDIRIVWMQEGIRDDKAVRLAEERGITVVQDRCMAKEHRRLFT